MDGFDQDESAGEVDENHVVPGGLFAAQGDALEPLELADELLDPGASLVEQLREKCGLVGRVGLARDDRANAALAGRRAVRFAVVSLVGQRRARRDVGAEVEQGLELAAVAGLAAGEAEGDRLAAEVGLEMALGREPAPRAAERLAVLPPLAPAAETWARTTVLSNICTRCAVGLRPASAWKNASNTPARLSRQKRFQTEFQGPNSAGNARQVMLWTVKWCRASRNLRSSRPLSPQRASSLEHLQRNRPVLLRRPRQHGQPSRAPARREAPIKPLGNPPGLHSPQSVHRT